MTLLLRRMYAGSDAQCSVPFTRCGDLLFLMNDDYFSLDAIFILNLVNLKGAKVKNSWVVNFLNDLCWYYKGVLVYVSAVRHESIS